MSHADVRYMAIGAERRRVPVRAERGWWAMQAAAAPQRRESVGTQARWAAGAILVRLGGRLQGAAGSASPVNLPAA